MFLRKSLELIEKVKRIPANRFFLPQLASGRFAKEEAAAQEHGGQAAKKDQELACQDEAHVVAVQIGRG